MKAEYNLTITPTNKDFAYWRSRSYVTEQIRNSVEGANLLILPYEEFRESLPPVFAKGTGEMYRFLRRLESTDFRPELCMNDDDYQEIELNHWVIDLGIVILDKVALPLFLSAVYDFIKKRVQASRDGATIKIEVIEQSENVTRSIRYEGLPEQFGQAFANLAARQEDTNANLNNLKLIS